MTARVPSGVRSRWAEAGAAGGDDEAREAVGEVAQRGGDAVDTVGDDTVFDHVVARDSVSRATSASPLLSSRVPGGDTVGDGQHLCAERHAAQRSRPGPRRRVADRRRGRERIVGAEDPGTRHEDVDTGGGREVRVVDLDAAVDLDLAARARRGR